MIALDTNVLVHAHRKDSPFHDRARQAVAALAEGKAPWAIPSPCLHEFYAKVTHPRLFNPPSSIDQALDQLAAWLESPVLEILTEGPDHFARLDALIRAGQITGPMVHDARIAALCLSHGVSELLTADCDFGRFPGLATRNPLVG